MAGRVRAALKWSSPSPLKGLLHPVQSPVPLSARGQVEAAATGEIPQLLRVQP